MTEWHPIETAPKDFDTDVTLPEGLPIRRLRMGPVIKVRGTHEGETEEFFVHWAQNDDKPAHWFIFDDEPLFWPVTEWRHLTPEEDEQLHGEVVPDAAR